MDKDLSLRPVERRRRGPSRALSEREGTGPTRWITQAVRDRRADPSRSARGLDGAEEGERRETRRRRARRRMADEQRSETPRPSRPPEPRKAAKRAEEPPRKPRLDPCADRTPLGRFGRPEAASALAHGARREARAHERDGQSDRACPEVAAAHDAAGHHRDHGSARPAAKTTHTNDDEAADPTRVQRAPHLPLAKPMTDEAQTCADRPRGGLAARTPPRPHPADRRNGLRPLLDVDVRMHDTRSAPSSFQGLPRSSTGRCNAPSPNFGRHLAAPRLRTDDYPPPRRMAQSAPAMDVDLRTPGSPSNGGRDGGRGSISGGAR
jgi:hypothetical protein